MPLELRHSRSVFQYLALLMSLWEGSDKSGSSLSPVARKPFSSRKKRLSLVYKPSQGPSQFRAELAPSFLNFSVKNSLKCLRLFKSPCNVDIIGQIDNNIIACKLHSSGHFYLMFVDQHAADERVRLEHLEAEFIKCTSSDIVSYKTLATFQTREIFESTPSLDHSLCQRIADCGLCFQMSSGSDGEVVVGAVKTLHYCLVGRRTSWVSEFVRSVVKKAVGCSTSQQQVAGDRIHPIVHTLLKSVACRNAIMFGQLLSVDQMSALVNRLKLCNHPDFCAHGRPTFAIYACGQSADLLLTD